MMIAGIENRPNAFNDVRSSTDKNINSEVDNSSGEEDELLEKYRNY